MYGQLVISNVGSLYCDVDVSSTSSQMSITYGYAQRSYPTGIQDISIQIIYNNANNSNFSQHNIYQRKVDCQFWNRYGDNTLNIQGLLIMNINTNMNGNVIMDGTADYFTYDHIDTKEEKLKIRKKKLERILK